MEAIMNKAIGGGLKALFIIHCLVGLIWAAGLVFMPDYIPNLFGITMTADQLDIIRGYAPSLFGLSLMSWLGFRAVDWESVRIVVVGEVCFTLTAVLVSAYNIFAANLPSTIVMTYLIPSSIFFILFTWAYMSYKD
jgi:hypothetical protein